LAGFAEEDASRVPGGDQICGAGGEGDGVGIDVEDGLADGAVRHLAIGRAETYPTDDTAVRVSRARAADENVATAHCPFLDKIGGERLEHNRSAVRSQEGRSTHAVAGSSAEREGHELDRRRAVALRFGHSAIIDKIDLRGAGIRIADEVRGDRGEG